MSDDLHIPENSTTTEKDRLSEEPVSDAHVGVGASSMIVDACTKIVGGFSLGLMLLFVAFAAPAITHAQVRCTWGGGSGEWEDAGKWDCGKVPADTDTAVVDAGTAILTIDTEVAGFEFPGGTVAGTAEFIVLDSMTWSGGRFEGEGTATVASGAGLLMTGSNNFVVSGGRTFVNAGEAVWQGEGRLGDTGRFVNEGELILTFEDTGPFGFCFSSVIDALVNGPTGHIRYQGIGEALVVCGFNNAGIVSVEQGSLNLRGFNATGGNDDGAYIVHEGATLVLGGGVRSMSETTSVTGAGKVDVRAGTTTIAAGATYDVHTTRFSGSGTLNINGFGDIERLELADGVLGGSGTITVSEALDWTKGDMGGSGTTIVPSSSSLSISGEAQKGLHDTRILRNESDATWSGTGRFSNSNGTLFLNTGDLEISAGNTDAFGTFFASTFTNAGTVTFTSGTVTRFSSFFNNEGIIRVESGTLILHGFNANGGVDTGRYEVSAGARLEFTGGVRTLTETAEVAGSGAVVVGQTLTNQATWMPGESPGILNVESDFPAGTGVLEIEIGGAESGTEHDVLAVSEEAQLSGTLRIMLTDGYAPQIGDSFTVLTAEAVSGSFEAIDVPAGQEGYGYDVSYSDTSVIVSVAVPSVSSEPQSELRAELPSEAALHSAYPHPFNPRATIPYDVAELGPVRLVVYDALGREAAVLVDERQSAGRYEAVLEGTSWPSGAYLIRMTTGSFTQTRIVVLAK